MFDSESSKIVGRSAFIKLLSILGLALMSACVATITGPKTDPGLINRNSHAPVGQNQSQEILVNTSIEIVLSAMDEDADSVLTFELMANPEHGVLSGNAPNLRYTPNADFIGIDSFTFKASDGLYSSEPATVSLNVVAVDPLFSMRSTVISVGGGVSRGNGISMQMTIGAPIREYPNSSATGIQSKRH